MRSSVSTDTQLRKSPRRKLRRDPSRPVMQFSGWPPHTVAAALGMIEQPGRQLSETLQEAFIIRDSLTS